MKNLFSSLLFFVLTITVKAQNENINQLKFGLLLGANASNLTLNGNLELNMKIAPSLGFDIGYNLSPNSSIHIQPMFTKIDANYRIGGFGYNDFRSYYADLDISTIKIPILYRYNLGNKAGKIHIESGMILNGIIHSFYKQTRGLCGIVSCSDIVSKGSFSNPITLSAFIGVGKTFKIGRFDIPLSLRYESYFNPQNITMSSDFGSQFSYNYAMKFRNLSLVTGFIF